MAHNGGRPPKYNENVIDKLDEYLTLCGREQTELPTVSGFAVYLGVVRETVWEWTKSHPEFSNAIKRIMTIQEKQLINDGIYGGKEVNATIIKLMLQNNHGYKERSDVTTNDKPIESNTIVFTDFRNETSSQSDL